MWKCLVINSFESLFANLREFVKKLRITSLRLHLSGLQTPMDSGFILFC